MNNYDEQFRDKENNSPAENTNAQENWNLLKTRLNEALPKTFNWSKLALPSAIGVVSLIVISIFIFKDKTVGTEKEVVSAALSSAIKPPVKTLNIAYEIFNFDAVVGDTIFTKNGSILIFPKECLIDKNGKVVRGIVEIKVREFIDPLDYYLAGIPMTYDSAGITYNFISSGMIDIQAYQDKESVFVNPGSKPKINLVSTNAEKNTNLYILDTLSGSWILKGKDEVRNLKANAPVAQEPRIVEEKQLGDSSNGPSILPPQKASGKNPTIEILIDPQSFKELLVYNNLKFEVLNSNTETVGEDSKIEWDNVELTRQTKSSTYTATFTSGRRLVKYSVRPVLEGKDFDVALEKYNEKIKSFKSENQKRIRDEKSRNEKIEFENSITEIENKKIDELNILINARNERINKLRIAYELAVKEKQKKQDSLKIILEENNRMLATNQSLIRSFEIDGFGYWNCDIPSLPNTIPIAGTFIDENQNSLNITLVNISTINTNRIIGYNRNNLRVLPNENHIVWGVYLEQFYYLTYKEYEKLNITQQSKSAVFKLKKYEGGANNILGLKKILYGS